MKAWILVADLFLTLIVYLTVPVIYRLKKGGTTRKKARKYALLNAAVGWLIFTIAYAIVDINILASIHVAFIYYLIGKAIFTSKEEKIKEKVRYMEKKYGKYTRDRLTGEGLSNRDYLNNGQSQNND